MRYINQFIFAALVSIAMIGCSQNRNGMSDQDAVPYLEHVVKYPGETLGEISKWYTGTAANWRAILAFNPAMKATRIRLGDIVRIPRSLVIRDSPLPKRSAAGSAKSQPKKDENGAVVPPADAAQELIAEEEQAGQGDSDSETQANTPAEAMPPMGSSANSGASDASSAVEPPQPEPSLVPPLAHDDITPNKVQMDPEKRTEEIKRTREELLRELGEQY